MTAPAYLGAKLNAGTLSPMPHLEHEGCAILECGGTRVILPYTALHLMAGWLQIGSQGYSERLIASEIIHAFRSVVCEAAEGGSVK